jgi:undecaprenyl-diphosphatase
VSLSASILLGIIQGLTEFLPVSSSGHLAVAQHFIPGFSQPGVAFDIVLHLGTLLAILIYLRLAARTGNDPGGRGGTRSR